MTKYGETFLTRPVWRTSNERRVLKSRMQFRESKFQIPGLHYWELTPLGVIDGCPLLSKFFRLAATIDTDTNEIKKWGIRRWR